MVEVKLKQFDTTGLRVGPSVKYSAWNVFSNKKRGIVLHREIDGETFEQIRINEARLAELGFFPE